MPLKTIVTLKLPSKHAFQNLLLSKGSKTYIMKTLLPFVLALSYTFATIVVFNDPYIAKVDETFLTFDEPVKMKNIITVCIRFKNIGSMSDKVVFSSYDNDYESLGLYLEIEISRGFIYLDDKARIFKIPQNLQPFMWHHFCINSNEKSYIVVINGQQLYQGNFTNDAPKTISFHRLALGFYKKKPSNVEDYSNFYGEISELNIWSKDLSVKEMKSITGSCGNVQSIPNVLNWKEDASLYLNGNHTDEEIENLCPLGNPFAKTYMNIPNMLTPHDAMDTCKTLQAELAYPKDIEDYKTWMGKNH